MEARMFAVVSFTQDVAAGRPKYDPPKALFASQRLAWQWLEHHDRTTGSFREMTVVEMSVEAREPTHGDAPRAGLALEGLSGVRG